MFKQRPSLHCFSILVFVALMGCTCPPLTISPANSVTGSCLPVQLSAAPIIGTITWRVEGIVGGNNSVGTIDANGKYLPPNISTSRTVTVTASTSVGSYGTATVVIDPHLGNHSCFPPTISPANAVAGSCEPIKLTASPITDTITWAVEGIVGGNNEVGTIDSNGNYFPPNASSPRTINISAANASGGNSTATVTIDPLVGNPGPLNLQTAQFGNVSQNGNTQIIAGQIIVRYKNNAQQTTSTNKLLQKPEVTQSFGFENTVLYKGNLNANETKKLAAEISKQPNVQYAQANTRLQKFSVPKDVGFHCQWNARAPENATGASNPGSIHLPAAWDKTTGSISTVVAVLDTGILWRDADDAATHPELKGRVLPGYDFISDATTANDNQKSNDTEFATAWGNVDPDAYDTSDPEAHGTHLAGIIAANSNNEIGIAGINWNAKILPVRVLGANDASTFDAIVAMTWAAGVRVYSTILVPRTDTTARECVPARTTYLCKDVYVPNNPNPSKIINLSFGTPYTACSPAWQDAINLVREKGANVVVAAGNFAGINSVGKIEPANCSGVITVGASNANGARASYSATGARIDVLAPGGENVRGALPAGIIGPNKLSDGTFGYTAFQGTSVSAAHVSGVLSLMLGLRPELLAGEAQDILKRSSHALSDAACANGTAAFSSTDCGAGLIDARAALDLSEQKQPGFGMVLERGTAAIAPGESVTIVFKAERWNGFTDTITPQILGLPASVTASTVETSTDTWTVTLQTDPSAPRLDAIPISISGTATGQAARQAVLSLTVAAI